MRRWKLPQPDLFMTPQHYDLLPTQRTTVVRLLKVLLAEVTSNAASANDRMDHQGAHDDQDHS